MEKLLLYCTKATPYLVQGLAKPMHTLDANNPYNFNWKVVKKGFSNDRLNGKIVAECDCEKVEEIAYTRTISNIRNGYQYGNVNNFYTNSLSLKDEFQIKTCLSESELMSYFKPKNHRYEKCGYALHLKNLDIFDKPKELSEYFQPQNCCMNSFGGLVDDYYPIKKAPQNMMYVYDKYGNRYILLPIKPQYLCKILNGEKTIEVRRVVTNNLKKLTGE